MPRRFLPSLLLFLCLTGCRPAQVLDALTPSTGYRLESGIAYGALPKGVPMLTRSGMRD